MYTLHTWKFSSWQNDQADRSFAAFQQVDGLLMADAVQRMVIHGHYLRAQRSRGHNERGSFYLISAFEAALLGRGARVENGLDEDGHIAVRRPEAADDGEAQTLLAAS